MKTKLLVFPFAGIMVLAGAVLSCEGVAGPRDPQDDSGGGPLVPQALDYTENPVDIPNPDRGFYRANDGLVVPLTGLEPGINTTVNVGNAPAAIGGNSSVLAATRVSHMYFDLRRFSGNAFLKDHTPKLDDNTPLGTWLTTVVPATPKGTNQALTEPALAYIRGILQQVRDGSGVGIVRFNYDSEGYSWIYHEYPNGEYIDRCVQDIEPPKETLLQHISQLKPVLREYEDVIMAVDGGFFGPWGEMHSTSFGTDPEAYAWLLDALLDAVPPSRSIMVHAGAFLSWYNHRYNTRYSFDTIDTMPPPPQGSPEARFGFFNDSYGYGADKDSPDYPDDWGSLSEGAQWLPNAGDYDRGKLMTWIRKQNNFYGGEAQGGETPWNTFPFAAWEASYAQTVYLNADYEEEVHQRWIDFTYTKGSVSASMANSYPEPGKKAIFDPVYNGKNGAEYWRDRLGYRLVLRQAKASKQVERNGSLVFEGKIQNVGFGNVVNRKDVYVILKSKTGPASYRTLTDLDARDWRPDTDNRASNTAAYRDLSFSARMSDFDSPPPPGDYDIYLKINDPLESSGNKRCVRFANNGNMWNSDLGANLIGSTTVL